MVMVVPTVGKPGCPCCNVSSLTGATLVTFTGWASEMTAMSFGIVKAGDTKGTKPGCLTKLVMPAPGPAMGANDIDGIPSGAGTKQGGAVRIVRELISEPVQDEPGAVTPGTPGGVLPSPGTPGPKRLTTLGNWLPAS